MANPVLEALEAGSETTEKTLSPELNTKYSRLRRIFAEMGQVVIG